MSQLSQGSVLSFQRGFLFSAWTGGDERAVPGNLGKCVKWLIVDSFFLWVADEMCQEVPHSLQVVLS